MTDAEIQKLLVELINKKAIDIKEFEFETDVASFFEDQATLYEILIRVIAHEDDLNGTTELNLNNGVATEGIRFYFKNTINVREAYRLYKTTQNASIMNTQSILPLLSKNAVNIFIKKLNYAYANFNLDKRTLSNLLLAALLYENSINDPSKPIPKADLPININKAYINYYKDIKSGKPHELKKNIETGILNDQYIDITRNQKSLQELEKNILNKFAYLDDKYNKVNNSYNDLNDKSESALKTILTKFNESEERINNYENTIKEMLRTNNLGKLWDSRAKSSFYSLLVSGGILAFMIIGAIAGIIIWKEFILAMVHTSVSDSTSDANFIALQISRALLIAVPVIMYFWAIKLIIRFFIRSLLLLDDANQRRTIMDTYLHMVKEGAVDPQALPMILWALCRQVPGHGSDGIEPPDFTEVLSIAKNLKN